MPKPPKMPHCQKCLNLALNATTLRRVPIAVICRVAPTKETGVGYFMESVNLPAETIVQMTICLGMKTFS